MAASSSRMRPRSTACQPFWATSASSVARFESRIWPGRQGAARLDQLVAGRQHADPRARVGEHLRRRRSRPARRGGPGASTSPGANTASPTRRSSPATRTASPGATSAPERHPGAVVEARACARPSRTASAPSGIGAPVMIRMASPGLQRPVGRVAGRDLGDDGQHHRRRLRGARRCRRPAPRSRPWRCWRTAGRPPATSRASASTHPTAAIVRVAHRRERARPARARGRGPRRAGSAATSRPSRRGISRCPALARSRRATGGTRGRGPRGPGPARRWPAGSRACCRCRSGPRRRCTRRRRARAAARRWRR